MVFKLVLLTLPLACLAGPVSHGETLTSVSGNLATTRLAEREAAKPSSYPLSPGPFPGEFLYVNWDPDADADTLRKIHSAFKEAQDMAAQALMKLTDDSEMGKSARARWFGEQASPEQQNNVFGNMYDARAGHASTIVSGMVLDKNDYWDKVDGKPYCEAFPTLNAYMRDYDGRFHICQRGLDKKLNSEILCDDLDASCSLEMRSLSMIMLHEWTHYDKIGSAAINEMQVGDYARGAYDCFKLDDDDKGENAQNYAWFAGEIHWGMYCPKTFENPKEGIK